MFPLFILVLSQKYEAQKSTDLLSDPTCNKPLRNDLSLGYSHIKEYLYLFEKIIKILPFSIIYLLWGQIFLIHSNQNILQQMIAAMGFLLLS